MKTNDDAVELTLKYFQNGLYCSEAAFRAFNEVYDLKFPEELYKITTAFGRGMGETGCACGAVTGCVLIISLIAGRKTNNETDRTVFTLTNELQKKFKEKHKAICCRVLTKNITWGKSEHKKLCEIYVKDAALITDSLIKVISKN